MSNNKTETWVEKLEESITTSTPPTDLEVGSEGWYEYATQIVEPKGIDDSYFNFMEEDPDNWAGFVSNVLGSEWGMIAKQVNENGY